MFRSIKELIRKYSLELTAATFLIVDHDDTSLDIACLWQKCMGGKVRTLKGRGVGRSELWRRVAR